MMRLLCWIALLALMMTAVPGFALDVRQATWMQRQVRSCMIKRMTSDKTLSYNDAKRACSDELKTQSNTLAAPTLAAPLASVSRQGG